MNLTISLSPEEEISLQTVARQEGLDLGAMVKKIVHERLSSLWHEEKDPTLELFDQWDEEDMQRTAAEYADDERIYAEIEKNVIPRTRI
jgi:hypothetical protein